MKKSTINFSIDLDQNNIPETINWDASDRQGHESTGTKAISLGIWDDQEKNALRIDLWTKDMPVHEMKMFYINSIGGMAQSLLTATGDEFMVSEMNALCDKLIQHLQKKA